MDVIEKGVTNIFQYKVHITNLNYLGPAVPSPGDGSQGKAITIIEECCPTQQITTIDTVLCNPVIGEKLFILDLIGCSICEGEWTVDPLLNDFNFDNCDNSIVIDVVNQCGSFNVASDGMGGKLCPAFSFTYNVCVAETPSAPAISITDNVCEPETAGSVNVDTLCPAGNTIEFSTDGGATWSTAQPAYDEANTITLRARCVNDFSSDCISTETADATSSPLACCPPVNCINQFGEFTIQKRTP